MPLSDLADHIHDYLPRIFSFFLLHFTKRLR
jgi:hypothetical protein